MYEKALIVIIFMYASGFMILAFQYVIGDVYNIELTNYQGTPIRSNLLNVLDMDELNQFSLNVQNANSTYNSTLSAVENSFAVGFGVAQDLLLLLTGTYIFNILYLLGVPIIAIVGMVSLYMILLARAIIAYFRGL